MSQCTFYNKQWEKSKNFWNDNISSSIYLYVTVQNCHIRGKRDNNGEKINTKRKEMAKFSVWSLWGKVFCLFDVQLHWFEYLWILFFR